MLCVDAPHKRVWVRRGRQPVAAFHSFAVAAAGEEFRGAVREAGVAVGVGGEGEHLSCAVGEKHVLLVRVWRDNGADGVEPTLDTIEDGRHNSLPPLYGNARVVCVVVTIRRR